jgi:hypothetical protein
VAHLCLLYMLEKFPTYKNPIQKQRILSIAFGGPFIGDESVANKIAEKGLSDHIFTFVNHDDVVPRLSTAINEHLVLDLN